MRFIKLTLRGDKKNAVYVNPVNIFDFQWYDNPRGIGYTQITGNFGLPTTNGGMAYTIQVNERPEQILREITG